MGTDDITIASMNVRGLADPLKRADLLQWLKGKNFSIYCLQDFHCTDELIPNYEIE